jgi:hypothetical protein
MKTSPAAPRFNDPAKLLTRSVNNGELQRFHFRRTVLPFLDRFHRLRIEGKQALAARMEAVHDFRPLEHAPGGERQPLCCSLRDSPLRAGPEGRW